MLLAFDTATANASIAVYDMAANQLLGELTWAARRRHTQDLLTQTDRLLQLLDLTPGELTHLAVTTGPGSFTGVRIAISVVKGMALALPTASVIGIPTLSASAAPWLAAAGATQQPTLVCACIQAGRGRLNWAWFSPHALLHRPDAEEHTAGTAEEFVAALAGANTPVWVVGEVDLTLGAMLQLLLHVTAVAGAGELRRAGHLAAVAAQHFAAGTRDEVSILQPLYLRAP